MSDCEKIHPLIPFYAEKSLSPARRDQVEAHLKICPEAQQDLESVQVLFEAMAGLPEPNAPLDLHRKIMDFVVEEKKPVPEKKPAPAPAGPIKPVFSPLKRKFQFFPYWALAASGLVALLVIALNPGLWESAKVASPQVTAEGNESVSQAQSADQTDKTKTVLAMNKPAPYEKAGYMEQAPQRSARPVRMMAMRAKKKAVRHMEENTEVLAYAKEAPAGEAPGETVFAMNRLKAPDESSPQELPSQGNTGVSKDLAPSSAPMASLPMEQENKAEASGGLQSPQLFLPTNTIPGASETASAGQPMVVAALPASKKMAINIAKPAAKKAMESPAPAALDSAVKEEAPPDTSKELPPPPESGYSEEMGPAITSSSGLTMEAVPAATGRAVQAGPASVYSGDNGISTVEQAGLITDSKTLQETWKFLRPEEPAPKLDFDNQAVVFMQAGEEPTGGYSVNMTSLDQGGDQWVVHWKVEGPADDSTVTESVTRPWTLQVIPKPDKPVEFQKEKP